MDKLRDLMTELKITTVQLRKIEKRLTEIDGDPTRSNEWEILYGKEFELCVRLSGIHGDILKLSKRLKNQENELEIKRIQKELNKLYKPLILEV